MKRNPILRVSGLWLLASGFSHAILDTNDNGLSDFWERLQNSGELFDGSFDPQADPDGDGWTNLQEAAAGTSPFETNPPDGFIRPAIAQFPAVWAEDEFGDPYLISPESVTVTWPTLAGKSYTLLFSTELSSWLPVGDPFTASGGESTYGFEIAPGAAFWRVKVEDADADGEGLNDHEESLAGTDPALPDTDGDTHTDLDELIAGTDPLVADTDGDGLPDDWEIANGLDPNDAADANLDPDGDGYGNLEENAFGSDPNTSDIGVVQPGFGGVPEGEQEISFRDDHPSDLYHQDSVPGWEAHTGEYIEIWDEGDGNPYIELQSHLHAHGVKQVFSLPPGTRVNYILRYKGRYGDIYGSENYDNAFTLKVAGASGLLVDGAPISPTEGVRSHAFMETDNGTQWAEWHYASVSITAPTGGTALKQLTLSFVPTATTVGAEDITYGGFVDLLPVEIEIRKNGEATSDESVIVKTGDILEFALAEQYFEQGRQFEDLITWQFRQMKADGTYEAWADFGAHGKGSKFEHTTALGGIFQVKVIVDGESEFFYDRDSTEEIEEEFFTTTIGPGIINEPDSVGVCDDQKQIDLCRKAQELFGSRKYDPLVAVEDEYGFPEYPASANALRCNIFVAHMGVSAGLNIPKINGFFNEYPPLANEWAGIEWTGVDPTPGEFFAFSLIPNWPILLGEDKPQPGWIIAHPSPGDAGHVGIIDYDGGGIGAGTSGTVNKNFEEFFDGTSQYRKYEE